MLRFFAAVFFSASLLFLVQPMMAKAILPWYGGSAAVWTACMMFFQILLVVGYGYSHLLRRYLTPAVSFWTHLAVMIFGCCLLPITPASQRRSKASGK